MGASDGWTDLRDDYRMDWSYARAPAKGNVVQIAELPLTGKPGHRHATLALGFGASAAAASSTAGAALAGGFGPAAERYAAGWHSYLDGLTRPRSVAGHATLYDVSAMVLAALEDKTYRGGGIASPSQLGRSDADTWSHVERAAACILKQGPTSQERWENSGDWYSPATIAAEVAALVCAAEIAERNGAGATAASYRATADDWQRKVAGWTRTRNGPLSSQPYYLRLTSDGNADAGTTYTIGDGGPTIDQRRIVDASFLELVRLGVKPADDRDIRSTLPVVDRELGVMTPNGQFWHRYNYDGYGETPDGGMFSLPGNRGRLWPLLAGERGEYELAAGELSGGARRAAAARLDAIAATASEGWMLPEQVWDDAPPAGRPGFAPGTGTLSATPLAWTHAQFMRLAWSIDAGRPVERPDVVACRYAKRCRP